MMNQKKRIVLKMFAMFLFGLMFSGCLGMFYPKEQPKPVTRKPSYHVGIIVCRLHEADKARHGTDSYNRGEVPAVKILGYGGKTVDWDLTDIESGKILLEETTYIPKGMTMWWTVTDLSPGSYQVRLFARGGVVDTYTFYQR